MSHHNITLFLTAFAALVSAAMWIDYYRRIDVFEPEKTWPLIVAVVVGCSTSYLSLFFYRIFDKIGFLENGHLFHDLLYSIFAIGLNEEVSKIIGVILVLTLFKKKIDEPIDILIYAGVTAIGFSMIENYNYFYNHGLKIITPRTFYSALEHIINTTLIVYGFYRRQLFKKGNQFINVVVSFTLAIASHGLFDFFLMDNFLGYITVFISLIIYLVGINFWVQMLNNANNFSKFFDYGKIYYTDRLFFRLCLWYALTVSITFVNNLIVSDLESSIKSFFIAFLSDGLLFFVVMLRVSRFKIFKEKYLDVKLQFPFYFTKNMDEDFKLPFVNLRIKVRGENHLEHLPTKYIGKNVQLYPQNIKRSFLHEPVVAKITNKYLLFDDVVVYSVLLEKAILDDTVFLLKPKTRVGKGFDDSEFPIEGLYKTNGVASDISKTDFKALEFIEWVYLKV